MLVELGNPEPSTPIHGFDRPVPAVTVVSIPDSYHPAGDPTDPDAGELSLPSYGVVGHNVDAALVGSLYGVETDQVDAALVREHYGQMRLDGVTRLPGSEALVAVTHPLAGIAAVHGRRAPSWVRSEDSPVLARQIAGFYGVPDRAPDDVELTHFTRFGPPGVGPLAHGPELTTLAVGEDFQWMQMFAGIAQAGAIGTSTGTGTTSMTDSGASWGTTKYVGGWVQCGNRIGNILSHTGTVLTIDRWYDPTNRGGAAGSTPGATTAYVILPSGPPADFMGLSANSAAVVPASDTTLPGEITTASGGLIRKICPLAHTLGTATGTLTPVFTANGSDTLPVTIAKVGISASILSTWSNRFHTLLGTTATLSLSGDQLTVTDTVTLS